MNRRNFLKSTGAAVSLSIIPKPILSQIELIPSPIIFDYQAFVTTMAKSLGLDVYSLLINSHYGRYARGKIHAVNIVINFNI